MATNWGDPTTYALGFMGASKNLERMARAAVVRPNEAEDIGTNYSTDGQRRMAGLEQVLVQGGLAFIAAGGRFSEVPVI